MMRKIEWLMLSALLLAAAVFTADWAVKSAIHSSKDVTVPDVTGRPFLEALEVLSRQNLAVKKEGAEFNDAVPAGTVLRQLPDAGLTVREGKVVRLTLSQGGENALVPDLTGLDLRTAEIQLRQNLLALGEIQPRPSLKQPKNAVMAQKPEPNKVVGKNTLVHVEVSQGPPEDGRMLMPDFAGKPWSEVLAWSRQTGIEASRSEDPSSFGEDTVLEQSVPPDDDIDPSLKIAFTVAVKRMEESSPREQAAEGRTIRFEVPQGGSAKLYSFVLVDDSGTREIWRGNPAPGAKLDIPLPKVAGSRAKVRIFVNGILTGERDAR
ncbi:MAG: hypothetical protein A2902_05335 [Elusimicrobia bacterium RIFCSPLOWO2_01_FULL_64_13]|nr:MAG: hypothetical protein A2636_03610 [Elusimicrobia bacterium RIFCSPHIGHO2_01_FULL_64_10]OGR95350.1 MAG: hypothetical protein A2902_05335 [Elusimicrobia bacterium RIFCSPLOWO2_01_FULL_64_13]